MYRNITIIPPKKINKIATMNQDLNVSPAVSPAIAAADTTRAARGRGLDVINEPAKVTIKSIVEIII